jgi:NADH-quinone oxidoreductase subunit L
MEAPAPASALIHSATLVSAGLFLVLRFYPLCQQSWFFAYMTPVIGVFTAWYGGSVAYFQNDLKKILAYSTISHCGFLMALSAFSPVEYTLLYLYVHGFFKALAFLCVGNVLRFGKGYQDVRRLGQLWKYLPFEFFSLTLVLANLSGLPFFFGFYVKHLVVAGAAMGPWTSLPLGVVFAAATTGLLYSFKILYYTFFDTKKGRKSLYDDVNRPKLNRAYYTNSVFASILAIGGLLIVAYLILILSFYQKLSLGIPLADSASILSQTVSPAVTAVDHAILFNASSLN